MANVWFSTYKEGLTPKLIAIIADVTGKVAEDASGTAPHLPTLLSKHPGCPGLSERDAGVLRLVVQGLANKAIAARMEISESAAKNAMHQGNEQKAGTMRIRDHAWQNPGMSSLEARGSKQQSLLEHELLDYDRRDGRSSARPLTELL